MEERTQSLEQGTERAQRGIESTVREASKLQEELELSKQEGISFSGKTSQQLQVLVGSKDALEKRSSQVEDELKAELIIEKELH